MIRRGFWWMEPMASAHWKWEKWSRFCAPNCRWCFRMTAVVGNSTTCVEQITLKSSRKRLKVCLNSLTGENTWSLELHLWSQQGINTFIWRWCNICVCINQDSSELLLWYNERSFENPTTGQNCGITLDRHSYRITWDISHFFHFRYEYGSRWTLLLVRRWCWSHCLLLHRL